MDESEYETAPEGNAMVVKPRLLIAITTTASLVLAAALPMAAAFDEVDPDPLRKENLLRVQDIQAVAASSAYKHGAAVAIGWREGSKPSRLFLTWSIDGGKSFRKTSGKLRKAPIAGQATSGMSLDICGGRVWAGSAVALGKGDAATDVMLSSRQVIGGAGAQSLIMTSNTSRKVRDVSLACVSDKLLAIGWLEQSSGKNRVRIMLRSLELPGKTPDFRRVYGLGEGRFKGGLDVAATGDSVHVAWSRGSSKDIAYKRFLVGDGKVPSITKKATRLVGWSGAGKPKLAARSKKVALGYLDAGRVKTKVSTDQGASFGSADVIVTGTKQRPSKLHSIDVAGSRIVVGASANKNGKLLSRRVTSGDLGGSWASRAFGNNGARMGALLKRGSSVDPLLRETWHNSASGKDTLRARYEQS